MPDGNRLKRPSAKLVGLVVALSLAGLSLGAGVFFGLSQQTAYEQEARHRSAEYAKYARNKVADACVSVVSANQAVCKRQAETEYHLQKHDNDRNEYDLVAQRKSALWTAIMGIAALIGMGLSSVGVWLVWTTFRETRRTAEIADANYKAFTRFESAIIKVEFDGVPSFFNDSGKRYIRFKIKCRNIGRSSAWIAATRVEGGAEKYYNFISEAGAEALFTDSFKVCIDDTNRVRGYVQYSNYVEQQVRRLFRVEIKGGELVHLKTARLYLGGMLRREDERYETPFN